MSDSRWPRLLRSCVVFTCSVLWGLPVAAAPLTGFTVVEGHVVDAAGAAVPIRGVNHFGFNTDILVPQFLWTMGWKEQLAQIKALGFNAVRLPIAPATLHVLTPVDQFSYIEPRRNADLLGKTSLQVLDLWMAEADRLGLYVLIDMHSVSTKRQYPSWFVLDSADWNLTWNGLPYTQANWVSDLAFVAARYVTNAHFMGIDLYNEPNGAVRWFTGDATHPDPTYYWKTAAETAGLAVLAANPSLLVFVEGINGNYDGVENPDVPMNWGEDLQPHAYQPLAIPAAKLVLAPHTYGPDVYVKSSFLAGNFPANLAADWNTLFGQFFPAYAVVPGEWGGRYGFGGNDRDVTWQNAFVDYLLSKGMRDSFYWCYTPNSGDTGGILDDNLDVRQDKMALLRRLWGGSAPAGTGGSTPASASSSSASAGAGGALDPRLLLVAGILPLLRRRRAH
ncbi:MAG TPA: glycoside hydrolase family 5 protein [Candidatus Binatia bacterium]|nr:glycoside hydrolase family 5 protein [Candidatus Binatia bacterium]